MFRGRDLARWALRLAVSLGLLAYVFSDLRWGALLRAVQGVRLSLVAAGLGLYLLGQAGSAMRWMLLGRSVGLQRSLGAYLRFYFIGMFFNLFGPSTVGGDVVRGLYLGDGRRLGLALNSVLFDRLSGLALLMALGAGALLVFPYRLPWVLETATITSGFALVIGWWTCPRLVRLLPAGNRLRRLVEVDLAPFWRDRRLLLVVSVSSVVFHLSQVGVQWLLARAVGVAVPFAYCLVFHPLLSVMIALPVSLGGFGVREGGYVYFLARIRVEDSLAVTIGLVWWAVTMLAGLLGGTLFLAGGAALPPLPARLRAGGASTAG